MEGYLKVLYRTEKKNGDSQQPVLKLDRSVNAKNCVLAFYWTLVYQKKRQPSLLEQKKSVTTVLKPK